MADPRTTIQHAFEKLKLSVSVDDAHKFASTELEDVWATLRDIEVKQRQRRSVQNLRRVEPLLRGIEKYRKVIEVLCNGTPYMPYVWAPIKLMLEIASNHRDVFEALLSAYADIGAALPRFDRYKSAFDDNLEFQQVLATVYSSILEFHQRAYKFLTRRAWHLLFSSLWTDFGGRFECIIKSLKQQRDFVDKEAVSFHIVESKLSRCAIQDQLQRAQKKELDQLKDKEENTRQLHMKHSISWLSIDEKNQEIEYERTSRRRHLNTCEWITEDQLYRSWIKDDNLHLCLWLDGKPGSGKSVMCSYFVESLKNVLGLTSCYYFCHSSDPGNVCENILSTICVQILRQHPSISTLVANEYVYRGLGCVMSQLKQLVPKLLAITGYTRVVVDGLDECSMENQKLILKELLAVCVGQGLQCKILLSSRRETHIRKKLEAKPNISLDEREEVNWDIGTFVKHKMAKIQTSNQGLREMLEEMLVEKANGMFLWVRLVIDELRDCYSDFMLEKTVKSMPKGLKAAYGRILDRIMDPKNSRNARDMAIRILGWMACSYRVLKRHELLDGIALDFSNTSLNEYTRVQAQIMDLCRPLIEDGPGSTVDFVHFSAKEYILEENYHGARPFIWTEKAQLDIAYSCVTFLNSCTMLLPSKSTEVSRAAIIVRGFHGLLAYADKFWHKHVVAYLISRTLQHCNLSQDLLIQLQYLLKFRKDSWKPNPLILAQDEQGRALSQLDHYPEIQSFINDTLAFRLKQLDVDSLDKSPEVISTDACEKDSTFFSTLRRNYQLTLESLLEKDAAIAYPDIDQTVLKSFRGTFGSSGFFCRFLHCALSSDGFESSYKRDSHESQHQRRFRCGDPSCAFFASGFMTRTLLKKHNEKYHAALSVGPSLADSLREHPHVAAAVETSLHGSYGARNGPLTPNIREGQTVALNQEAYVDVIQGPHLDSNIRESYSNIIPAKDRQAFPNELRVFTDTLLRAGWRVPSPDIETWGQLKLWAQNNKAPSLFDKVHILYSIHQPEQPTAWRDPPNVWCCPDPGCSRFGVPSFSSLGLLEQHCDELHDVSFLEPDISRIKSPDLFMKRTLIPTSVEPRELASIYDDYWLTAPTEVESQIGKTQVAQQAGNEHPSSEYFLKIVSDHFSESVLHDSESVVEQNSTNPSTTDVSYPTASKRSLTPYGSSNMDVSAPIQIKINVDSAHEPTSIQNLLQSPLMQAPDPFYSSLLTAPNAHSGFETTDHDWMPFEYPSLAVNSTEEAFGDRWTEPEEEQEIELKEYQYQLSQKNSGIFPTDR